MPQALLEIHDLRVDYPEVTAARDFQLSMAPGEVWGLIGPNGAGKTSVMRAAVGLLEPTHGEVTIDAADLFLDRARALAALGFMPDFPPLYEDLTLQEFLNLFASAHGMSRLERAERVEQELRRVDLFAQREAMCGSLSRGMRQRLFLAKTLMHDPKVIVLDEPASGLDPAARAHFAQVIRDLAAQGRAVLVSSHILSEMESFCTHAAVLDRGRLISSGPLEDLGVQPDVQHVEVRVRFLEASELVDGFFQARDGVDAQRLDASTFRLRLDGGEKEAHDLLRDLLARDFRVCDFARQERSLQDRYIDIQGRRGA